MSDDLIERYKKLSSDVASLEAELELARVQRGVVAGQLMARDGKGHGYDLGDGVEQIVCATKVGTHYLVPRSKWLKPGRPAPALKSAKVVKAAKSKASVDPVAPASDPPPTVDTTQVAAYLEPVGVETNVAQGAQAPVAEAERPTVVETPQAETLELVDPLDAALAAALEL